MAMKGRASGLIGWIVVGLVIVGASIFYFKWRAAHASAPVQYRTVKVEKGTVAAKVTATGTLSARITVQVGAQVSGRIMELDADFNSQVKQGEVIARIDPRLFDAAVKKAKAEYAQAAASLTKAKANALLAQRNMDRDKALKDQGLLGQADFEAAEDALESANADVQVANANVVQAGADLNQAQINLGFTTIVSPIDGIVISRSVDVGQTVAASLSSPTLFTIAQDLRKIQVDTFVSEADVGKLVKDMPASFSVDAYPGTHFDGKIREVRNSATTTQNVVTYDAVIDVANDDLKLKPGMTANVTFVWSEKDDVLKVPNAALRFRPPNTSASGGGGGGGGGGAGGGGKPKDDTSQTVWVLENGAPRAAHVKTGLSDGTTTEIVSGDLKQGDEVIVDATTTTDASKTSTGKSPLQPGGGGGGGGPRKGGP